MNRPEFRAALKRHNISLKEFAHMMGACITTVRRYGGAEAQVPRSVALIISLLDQKRDAVKMLRDRQAASRITDRSINSIESLNIR